MDNTMKLLRAFIEASGYEIEKTIDTKETPISMQSGLSRISLAAMTIGRNDLVIQSDGSYKRGADDCYYLRATLDVDYKVTKRAKGGIKCTKCGTHLASDSPLDSCLCKSPFNLVRFG